MGNEAPLLATQELSVTFHRRTRWLGNPPPAVQAVKNVSLSLNATDALGVVGESGSGKTTLARTILGLIRPDSGSVSFAGETLWHARSKHRQPQHLQMSMVFQDPFSSLNPRMRTGDLIAEPMHIRQRANSRQEYTELVAELLQRVGLDPSVARRFPHEFSGGQRQRIGIARALAAAPSLVLLDEPVSALDVSIQAQIVNLLADLRQELSLTYLFIAHDIAVVTQLCDRIAVMYLGHIIEITDRDTLAHTPQHPYTQALVAAIPSPDPMEARATTPVILDGEITGSASTTGGCVFHPRCPLVSSRCQREIPPMLEQPNGSSVACHAVEEGRKMPI